MTPAHTQMLMGAMSLAAQVAGSVQTNRDQLTAQAALFGAKAELFSQLVEALVEKRVEAVRSGFSEVLGLYAEQARHFMQQQAEFAGAEIKSADPLERAELRKRLGEIDIELRRIRADARRVYTHMTHIVMRLGGDALTMSPEHMQSLALPQARMVSYG